MYETPDSDVKRVRIDEDVITGKKPPFYFQPEKPPVVVPKPAATWVDEEEEPKEVTGL